ncbi:ATP-binding protein [Streptomyces sp. NPDC003002]
MRRTAVHRTAAHRAERAGALSPARARALVKALVASGSAASADVLTDALLITSELVTNAVRHGGGVLHFAAEVDRHLLRISVTDPSRELPRTEPSRDPRSGAGGFGWPLICRLTESVTITPGARGGKTIRVALRLA